MAPTILEIFTSPSGSDSRKTVFAPGESIQWNIVHTLAPDFQRGTPFRVFWILRRYGEGGINVSSHSNALSVDLIFRMEVTDYYNSKYRWSAHYTKWWYDSIPEIGLVIDRVLPPTTTRQDFIDEILDRRAVPTTTLIFSAGLWELTGVVELPGADITDETRFDVLGGWLYRILPPPFLP
ncbi:MAG: hypothetical protein GY800_01170 [Planctomycetes bacterium]|nr:hypothetical protein [Planctomycetota bacterium]